jgi:hypothetical protein
MPYRVTPEKKNIIDEHIQGMLKQGVIEPSYSPHAAPVLVKKKTGEWRFCIDFRRLNEATIKDAYPLPRIDDTLEVLKQSEFFTVLDLMSGYWQVPVALEDRYKTAFTVHNGLYQFKVMPFGLSNAPATFQRLMNEVLKQLNWKQCVVYLDDIIVFGKSYDEHLDNLNAVLKAVETANLKIKASKCEFCKTEVLYLGHKVSAQGISPDPAKIRTIADFEIPKTKRQLKEFLGAANFLRQYIPNFSKIANPLYELTSEKVKFCMTTCHLQALKNLKDAIINALTLSAPDYNLPFDVHTDASPKAIGAVLLQHNKPIQCASRKLNESEEKKHIGEKEALAVLWASRVFKHYIHGREVTYHVDHKPLADLKFNKEPEQPLGKLTLRLQGSNYKIVYLPGKRNVIADWLSRPPEEMTSVVISSLELEVVDWVHEQRTDKRLQLIIEAIHSRQKTTPLLAPAFSKVFKKLKFEHGILCYNKRIILPEAIRVPEIKRQHEFYCHQSAEKLYLRIRKDFYWPRMQQHIKDYCKRCDVCQKTKNTIEKTQAPLLHLTDVKASYPFQLVSIDIQGPFVTSKSGKRYIMVAICYFSKWVIAECTETCSALETANFIVKQIIFKFGPPMKLLMDQGKNFESKIVKELAKLYGIEKARSSPYHPEGNGAVERENRSIKEMLRCFTVKEQLNWDQCIPNIIYTRNTTIHASTGYTPFEIVFGHAPKQSIQYDSTDKISEYIKKMQESTKMIEKEVKRNLEKAMAKNEKEFRKRNGERELVNNFKMNELVLLDNKAAAKKGSTKKLEPKFIGPFRVTEVTGPVNVKVKNLTGTIEKVVHINRIKKFYE